MADTMAVIEQGGNINPEYFMHSPLLIAIDNENEEMVDLLIEAGANINMYDILPLFRVVNCVFSNARYSDFSTNCLRILNKLLEYGMNINAQNSYLGQSIIHYIVNEENDPRIQLVLLKILFERGANPNLRDNSGRTALYNYCLSYPIKTSELKVVELLLDNGADPMIPDNEGRIVFDYPLPNQLEHILLNKDTK